MGLAADKSSTKIVGIQTSLYGDDCGRHYAVYSDGDIIPLVFVPRSERRQILSRYREKHGVVLQPSL